MHIESCETCFLLEKLYVEIFYLKNFYYKLFRIFLCLLVQNLRVMHLNSSKNKKSYCLKLHNKSYNGIIENYVKHKTSQKELLAAPNFIFSSTEGI